MKLLIALYFYMLATIQLGLLLGVYHYFRSQSLIKPSPFWMRSLIVSILALIVFGTGIVGIENIEKPEFNFTIANSLFYIAAIFQLLFCRSLNGSISKSIQYGFIASVVIFAPVFEYMRLNGTYEMRTVFMCLVGSAFFIWQIAQLRKKRKTEPSRQLMYLQYATTAELFFALARLVILVASGLTIRHIEQIPQVLILMTIAQLVMNTLSYIALGGYWAEKIALSNARSQNENQEIKALLAERENLISSLLKANKTAATGALSASIAHELNQPLGASQLNIQLLQMKLANGNMDRAQYEEVLSSLLSDNQRSAKIIQSLRSIFSDEKIGSEAVDINELVESVLNIAKAELSSKKIQVILNLSATILVNGNRGELQQVILNLVNNAVQALSGVSGPSKVLQIESRDTAEGIELLVTDNGPGINSENQAHLFELLASSNKKAGMGLGLWLCHHIVSRHSGQIGYRDAPGGGAQFIISLPQEQP